MLRLISQQRGARYTEDARLSDENPREEDLSPKVDLSLPVLCGDGRKYAIQHPWLCSASRRPGEPRAPGQRKDIKHCLPSAWPSHPGARLAPPAGALQEWRQQPWPPAGAGEPRAHWQRRR